MIQTSDVLGGLWIPGDGVGDPYEICVSLVSQVKKKGISRSNSVFPTVRHFCV
jgi:glycine/D-amino acid oxidase-like deaminating enzyme